MPQYADCYFLVDSRNSELVEEFLQKFLPNRIETCEEYLVQILKRRHLIFKYAKDVIRVLERHPNVDYNIYWSNKDSGSDISHLMVFYTDDSKAIFGISVPAQFPEEAQVISHYRVVKAFLKSEISCITIEEVSPSNSIEFIEFCKNRFVPNL